jgi:DNA mismatch endonuclease, patch repair protein
MQSVRRKDTKPERLVRSLLHRLGYRFRLHRRDLPGTPDIVFPSRRLVLFVHGCFWHGHDCAKGKLPKSNLEFWTAKRKENDARDRRKQAALSEAGWRVCVVWECEIADRDALAQRLCRLLDEQSDAAPQGLLGL